MDIQYKKAKALVYSAIEVANEWKVSISVAIVDGHGDLVAFGRMDDALLVTISVAEGKAYTSVRERKSTAELKKWVEGTGKDMSYWPDKKMTCMGGGLPIKAEGKVIGGIGVSGLSEEDDEKLGMQALKQNGF
ncbi:MAG: heme-binding protein [Bacteroidetes bacterium]|nr:heme-binding protein [Bacteroidota bacterium]